MHIESRSEPERHEQPGHDGCQGEQVVDAPRPGEALEELAPIQDADAVEEHDEPDQADRAAAFQAFHTTYEATANTYASLYNGVLQRDLFYSQARGYASTLDGALHGNNIPTTVVENLITTTKAGTEPLRRYHRLRKRILGLDTYHSYDTSIPLVDFEAVQIAPLR